MQILEFIKKQKHGEVHQINEVPFFSERLFEMGIHQGQKFEYLGTAPFRGPIIIKFGNTVIALRTEEAACLIVK